MNSQRVWVRIYIKEIKDPEDFMVEWVRGMRERNDINNWENVEIEMEKEAKIYTKLDLI